MLHSGTSLYIKLAAFREIMNVRKYSSFNELQAPCMKCKGKADLRAQTTAIGFVPVEMLLERHETVFSRFRAATPRALHWTMRFACIAFC